MAATMLVLGAAGVQPWADMFGFGSGGGGGWDPDDEPGCGFIAAVVAVIVAIIGLIFLVVAVTS